MSFDVDAAIDRRRLRRKLTFWRVLALVVIVAGIGWTVAASGDNRYFGTGTPHVARVTVGGLIRTDRARLELLEEIGKSGAEAVIIAINSPGGTVVGSEALSKLTNWNDRDTCVLFGDGAGAAVLERVEGDGFLGFELGSDGSGGPDLCVPAGGSRAPASADTVEQELHYLHMNGREIFKFATRAMVTSAERLLEECGLAVADIDLYVPHQANKRIIDHAVRHLHLPPEKVRINVDRYGNTSSASIPIALYEAMIDGALVEGMTVLMTAVGAGLSWGSTLLVWGSVR